jgi:N-methylhydantoinase A/oxoprolinase/acetone carboxylase beta subunit
LGVNVEEAALGAIKILNHGMIQSIEMNSVRKGYDPRDFALVAFGGAGPLQACEIAAELSIPLVIIPPKPGLTSALGLLATDLSYDFSRTQLQLLSKPDLAKVERDFAELEVQAVARLDADDIAPGDRLLLRVAECRYQGQGYELRVDAPEGAIDEGFVARLAEGFHLGHEREYGRRFDDKDIELVNIRVIGVGRIRDLDAPILEAGTAEPEAGALTAHREVVFDEGGRPRALSTPIYDRDRLKQGNVIAGPAIVEQADTTTLVLPGLRAEVDQHGNLLIRLGQ